LLHGLQKDHSLDIFPLPEGWALAGTASTHAAPSECASCCKSRVHWRAACAAAAIYHASTSASVALASKIRKRRVHFVQLWTKFEIVAITLGLTASESRIENRNALTSTTLCLHEGKTVYNFLIFVQKDRVNITNANGHALMHKIKLSTKSNALKIQSINWNGIFYEKRIETLTELPRMKWTTPYESQSKILQNYLVLWCD
jgi:hypothetical protein